jgi:hypothetical protein
MSDGVIGYLVVIAFVDDVRMFGTEPELQDYKEKIQIQGFRDPDADAFLITRSRASLSIYI